jgi:hypothetical protein
LLVVLVFECAGVSGAAAIEPAEGPFEGKTAEGYTVSFSAGQGAVFDVKFTVKWGYCGVSPVHIGRGSREIDANDHFLFDGGQWRFEGTFSSPTEVQGTATFLEHPLAGCPERAVPYTATLRTGPPPVIPRCRPRQLETALYEHYPGAHYHYLVLPLINRGDACTLRGFPQLRLRDAGKRPLPTRTVHEGRAPHVVLEPDEAVAFRVRWTATPGRGEAIADSCKPIPHSVLVHLPGAIVLHFPWHWGRVCQHGEIRVSAFP